MEPNCFGIIKGEQPLIRASRASKVAGAFLVLFCARKRVHIRRRCLCKSHISLPNATTLCAESFYFFTIFIRARFSSRMRSSTVFTAARISALGMRTASVAHG